MPDVNAKRTPDDAAPPDDSSRADETTDAPLPSSPLPSSPLPTTADAAASPRLVFVSAVDWWVAALLLFPVFAAAALGILLMIDQRPDDATWMFLAAACITVGTGLLTQPCRYTMLDQSLSMRCGLLVRRVDYADIREVKRTSTWRNGLALSLNRVLIATDRGDHIVSPKNREQFMIELRRRFASN